MFAHLDAVVDFAFLGHAIALEGGIVAVEDSAPDKGISSEFGD